MSTDSMCVLKKSQKKRTWYETKKKGIKIKEEDFVEVPMDERVESCPKELNPVSRVLQARSHCEVKSQYCHVFA